MPRQIPLDIAGKRLEIADDEARKLHAAAAARAGESMRARDLAVLLERSRREARTLVLRRPDAATLASIADELGLLDIRDRLLEAVNQSGQAEGQPSPTSARVRWVSDVDFEDADETGAEAQDGREKTQEQGQEGAQPVEPDEEAIRRRAYEIAERPGAGSPEENWHRAADELRRELARREAT